MTSEEIKQEVKKEIAEAMVNNLPAGVGEIIIREGKAVEVHEQYGIAKFKKLYMEGKKVV